MACDADDEILEDDVALRALTDTCDVSDCSGTLVGQVAPGNDKTYKKSIAAGTSFGMTMSKTVVNGPNSRFQVFFSENPSASFSWDAPGLACSGGTDSNSPSNTCTASAPPGGGYMYAYTLTRAVNAQNAGDYQLDYDYTGPCDGQSCYQSNVITVTNLQKASSKKPEVAAGKLPGVLAGQQVTVTIERSHSNVTVVNGLKFKTGINDGDTVVATCPTQWVNNVMTCTYNGPDAHIHIPLKRTTTSNSPARSATVTITRSGDYVTTQTAQRTHS